MARVCHAELVNVDLEVVATKYSFASHNIAYELYTQSMDITSGDMISTEIPVPLTLARPAGCSHL